jgi:hypothetical protein
VRTRKDITGQRFGMLVASSFIEARNGQSLWECVCDCGAKTVVAAGNLKRQKSCGCWRNEIRQKHGLCGTRLYNIYDKMKLRCTDPKTDSYKHYGGRGIEICSEWLNDNTSFFKWALANGYNDQLEIERIDRNGNYEPSNCKWATRKEQMNNTSQNFILEFNGEKLTLTEAAEKYNISRKTLWNRIKRSNWPIAKALTTPVITNN